MLDDFLSCLMGFWMKCNFFTARKKTRAWASSAIERIHWMHKAGSFHITARGSGTKRQLTPSDRRVFSLCRSCCPSFSFWSWQQREPRFSQLWYSREWNGAITGCLRPTRNWLGKPYHQKPLSLLPKLSFLTIALQLRFHFVLFCPALMNHTLWFAQWCSFVI